MPKTSSPLSFIRVISLAVAAALGLQGCATAPQPAKAALPPPISPVNTFGFPMGFSTEKMDLNADPRKDFKRYAAGRWLDAAVIPGDSVRVSSIDLLNKQVEAQVQTLLAETASASASAPQGSPRQQVGDYYAAGMDVERLTALGAAPIKPYLDRIAAISDQKALAETMAQLMLNTNEPILLGLMVSTDMEDRSRYTVYAGESKLAMGLDNYLKPEAQPIRDGYLKLISDYFVLAGTAPDAAKAIAAKVLAMETRIAAKKLSPVDEMDPNKRYVKMPYADLRRLLANVDLETYFRAVGLPAEGKITVVEVEALRERNAMLAEYPLADTKAYLQWELLRQTGAYLSPAFFEQSMAFNRVMYGKMDTPPRSQQLAKDLPTKLGHPLGQLYVAKHFSAETKRDAEALVGRIRAEFRGRIENNAWLSAATRKQALEKLDKIKIDVGYPAEWIDFSGVEIRRDDYFGNVIRANEFKARRDLAKLGQPVKEDGFDDPESTLPTVINAAYTPERNGIEIPAAFLQAPFYDPKADAALNYCALGAVIGHELTHGFDSQGRLYDAQGRVRDWWTKADAQHFLAETQKLVKQADAIEVVPGLHINGQLAVGENLADVGGVALSYAALSGYLREHPQGKIDGLTQEQRCFLSWAQTWADKANEGWLRQILPVDGHAPGVYRMAAPSQHERGFYEAFGIKAGDPLWLDEKARVSIW